MASFLRRRPSPLCPQPAPTLIKRVDRLLSSFKVLAKRLRGISSFAPAASGQVSAHLPDSWTAAAMETHEKGGSYRGERCGAAVAEEGSLGHTDAVQPARSRDIDGRRSRAPPARRSTSIQPVCVCELVIASGPLSETSRPPLASRDHALAAGRFRTEFQATLLQRRGNLPRREDDCDPGLDWVGVT
jgi:hypothetical protein